jgi:hypothetical protein
LSSLQMTMDDVLALKAAGRRAGAGRLLSY